eukprot:s3506_g5.t2
MQPQVARAFPAPRMECDSCAPRRRPCLKFFDGCGMLTGPGIQSMRIRRGSSPQHRTLHRRWRLQHHLQVIQRSPLQKLRQRSEGAWLWPRRVH